MAARAFLRRDPALVDLRALFLSGMYYGGDKGANATSGGQGNNTLRLIPFVVARTTLFTAMTCEITIVGQASSTIRLGMYDSDERFQPRALLVDAGGLAADSLTPTELTIALTLAPGVYWRAACIQGAGTTQPTVRVEGVGSPYVGAATVAATGSAAAYQQTATLSGALPSTPTAYTAVTSAPRVLLKAA